MIWRELLVAALVMLGISLWFLALVTWGPLQ